MSGLESSPSVFRYAVVAHGMSCKSAGPDVNIRKRTNTTAMKPIPHSRKHKLLSFLGVPLADANNGNQHKLLPPAPAIQRKSSASSLRAQQIVSLNPLPLKKHGCNRPPVQVVSRGGFYVGNGINWKGQVFSKMLIHTATNRMTGVGNTLKRHYETYLLEYELAHDDVDGSCCLLCHSSAPGDWVNCGLCGEWAHFGCDRRPGLATFKDYAKTDGLDYICPPCSMSNYKKSQKMKGKELQLVRYDWRQISSSPLELMVLGDASSGERKTDS
ncbi:ARID/BRIGHT DNA binding domain [Musa troglodytarum]|uniref:ARID/BRIGHT DNA binding domain n=1 Tax=Musa troglodytarum TaxID=320322 RepID=A0A9E7K4K5_9LILI|nr:ARID/BRIGHT DNA binding domain [Musa troglodytarum]